jgi:hypothetical protein
MSHGTRNGWDAATSILALPIDALSRVPCVPNRRMGRGDAVHFDRVPDAVGTRSGRGDARG